MFCIGASPVSTDLPLTRMGCTQPNKPRLAPHAMKSNSCGAPGVKVELDGYAGLAEAQGVGEVFVAEHVELGDLGVGGRQRGRVGDAGRGGVGGGVRAAGGPVSRPEPGQGRAPAGSGDHVYSHPAWPGQRQGLGRPAGRLPGDQFGEVSQRVAQMFCGKRGEWEWESLAENI